MQCPSQEHTHLRHQTSTETDSGSIAASSLQAAKKALLDELDLTFPNAFCDTGLQTGLQYRRREMMSNL